MYFIDECKFAYFSQEHLNLNEAFLPTRHRTLTCVTTEGEIVHPTSLGTSLVPSDSGYRWPDARRIGQVIAQLNPGETVRSVLQVNGDRIGFYVHPDELTRRGWFLKEGVWLPGCLGDFCQLADVTSK